MIYQSYGVRAYNSPVEDFSSLPSTPVHGIPTAAMSVVARARVSEQHGVVVKCIMNNDDNNIIMIVQQRSRAESDTRGAAVKVPFLKNWVTLPCPKRRITRPESTAVCPPGLLTSARTRVRRCIPVDCNNCTWRDSIRVPAPNRGAVFVIFIAVTIYTRRAILFRADPTDARFMPGKPSEIYVRLTDSRGHRMDT